jgi:hypothetical protein
MCKKANKANTADRLKRHFFCKKTQKNRPFKRPLIWSLEDLNELKP